MDWFIPNVSKKSVLVVDDEPGILDLVCQILSLKHNVRAASSAGEAWKLIAMRTPDLILADIYMPETNGISFCKALKDTSMTSGIPVIMMTGMNARETRISAFNSGADDFLEKPFYMDELVARVDAKLRQAIASKDQQMTSLSVADVILDLNTQRATAGGLALELSQIEFKILSVLAQRPGVLVKRDDLEAAVWGDKKPQTRSLDTHIASLRRKLGGTSRRLRTVYGEGYVFESHKAS